jgi:NADPH:quinone reductase-like Zn-dependent oxidoreductase
MPKRVEFKEYGSVDVLEVVEATRPVCKDDEILVHVKAAGLNPGEAKIRDGSMKDMFPATFPSGQGTDFAGIVEEVGPAITEWSIGDEVAGYTHNRASQAEYVLVKAKNLVMKPENVSWEVAGGLFVAGTTAYAAVEAVHIQPGETIVVSGAAGGVGGIASQLALLKGATVVGIANPAYHTWLTERGISPIGYTGDVMATIQSSTDHVDAFIDTSGHGYVKAAIDIGVDPSRINTIIDFQAVEQYHVSAKGGADAASTSVLGELLQYISEGKIAVPIARTFSVDDVRDAYTYMDTKHDIGKVTLFF